MGKNTFIRNGRKYRTFREYALALAKERGSTATTFDGAIRYLNSHRPPALAGISGLGKGTLPKAPRYSHGADTEELRRNQKERLTALAQRLASKAANSASPFKTLGRLCRRLTPNVYEAATPIFNQALGLRISSALDKSWPYRVSGSSWAGGSHYIFVRFGDQPAARGNSVKVWSQKGEWSGNDSHADLTFTRRCVETLGDNLVIGGLITLDCVPVAPREYEAAWAEQSRGFDLKLVKGWIIRGHHVTGGTVEQARRRAAKARTKIARQKLTLRTSFDGIPLAGLTVTVADSVNAGNCTAGTDSFVRTHRQTIAGRTEIPARELLALSDDVYTRRAIVSSHLRRRGVADADSMPHHP